jgi:signal transduction histidine kinase
LGHAYDLGRAALAQRLSLLDLVVMHHSALDRALTCETCRQERTRTLRAGGDLLAEMLSPFHMAQRAFLEVNAALRSSNELLEQEAHRVARLLHDSAGQIVFALQLAMADIDRDLPQSLRPRFKEMSQLLQQLDQQLRCHAQELYPVVLADLGLAAALRDLVDKIGGRAGLSIVFNCSLTFRPPADVESAVYRAVQEALTNTVRHARATQVNVTLGMMGAMLTCSLVDNGVGFLPRPVGDPGPGLGLVGIRDRMKSINGTVHIRSARGQGTHVILAVPLPAEEERHGIERHSR